MTAARFLVTGARGQIGSELVAALAAGWGEDAVISTDLNGGTLNGRTLEALDVTSPQAWNDLLSRQPVTGIFHLAAVLSAKAEHDPLQSWDANMRGLLCCLEAARAWGAPKVFWPSSIAVFGPSTPRDLAPQDACTDPATVYGISKLAGERWCAWYRLRHGLDVRSLRFPGLISWKTPPGGGTTDYAVDMLRAAAQGLSHTCFLKADQTLPMMHMDDAIRACLELMAAPASALQVSGSYNLGALSFSPATLAQAIRAWVPGFAFEVVPDFRQDIAASWPASVDDRAAVRDWGWRPRMSLEAMVRDVLHHFGSGG